MRAEELFHVPSETFLQRSAVDTPARRRLYSEFSHRMTFGSAEAPPSAVIGSLDFAMPAVFPEDS